MKTKYFLFSALVLFMINLGFSQKKDEPQNIISGKVSIAKYHDRNELEEMTKGDLLNLYIERVEVVVKILPKIAFATKPGVTMTSLGIPDTKEHRKAIEAENEATADYFDSTIEFQKTILPYSDKSNLISAILFYEETLKNLHQYNEFNGY
jgi:hypothetical protein